MKKNVGSVDKVMRIVAGLVIIALGVLYQSWWGVIGVVPLYTGISGSCLLYIPFGISTCKTEEAKK